MATIEDPRSYAHLEAALPGMPEEQLLAQSLVQQGAINCISTLLEIGCTTANATAMLESLRHCAGLIRQEETRRGKPDIFEVDQVARGQSNG
jgi:hypothetical protein